MMTQEIERLRHNNEGRRLTIEMLKAASLDWRDQWAQRAWRYDSKTNQSVPVIGLHQGIGINKAGRVINPLTGRYL